MTNTTTTEPLDTDAVAALVDGYFACWNATDATERRRCTEATWAPDARSVDPLAAVAGHDELAAMFAQFHEAYPGHSFRQRGGVDTHHQLVRWAWEMIDPDGGVALDGIDVALVADDGRISYLAGFFGADLPAG